MSLLKSFIERNSCACSVVGGSLLSHGFCLATVFALTILGTGIGFLSGIMPKLMTGSAALIASGFQIAMLKEDEPMRRATAKVFISGVSASLVMIATIAALQSFAVSEQPADLYNNICSAIVNW